MSKDLKVGIVIISYNINPEIFLLQIESIKKFCTDKDYTIEIVDNSSNLDAAEAIRYHAEQAGLNYTKTFSSSINSTDSHVFAANTSFNLFKDKYEAFAYIDHDLFIMKPFSVCEILSEKVMAGLGQGAKKKYFWPGIFFINLTEIDKELVDFGYCHDLNLDSGGMLYKLIDEYGEDKCTFFNESYHQNEQIGNSKYSMYAMINDGMFFHCIAGSNWKRDPRHEERMNTLLNIAKQKIDDYVVE